MNIQWLLGFYEGEGNCNLSIVKNTHIPVKFGYYTIIFSITFSQNNNDCLVQIKQFLQTEFNIKSSVSCRNLRINKLNDVISFSKKILELEWCNIDKKKQLQRILALAEEKQQLQYLFVKAKKIHKKFLTLNTDEKEKLKCFFIHMYDEFKSATANKTKGRPSKTTIDLNSMLKSIEKEDVVLEHNKLLS